MIASAQAKVSKTPSIMGLDGDRKMSKSLDNHIELAASPREIRRRVMTMVTDPARQYKSDPGHPEICNVMALHKIISSDAERLATIEVDCRNGKIGCVEHKKQFAEDLVRYLAPFRD